MPSATEPSCLPPETIAQRRRRIRAEKAAIETAEAKTLAKLINECKGLQALTGNGKLLDRTKHIAWTDKEWNELNEVVRKFRAVFVKMTLIQCELVARTQMKTSWLQLMGLPKNCQVWIDADNRAMPLLP